MVWGVDAGAAWSSRVKSETITRAAFPLPKLTLGSPGESRLDPRHCTTSTGLDRSVVVPSPSWPALFEPQQYAAPPDVTPQVCVQPAPVAATLTPPDRITALDRVVLPPSL